MKYEFLVAVRNDQGQVLILEKPPVQSPGASIPCFPGGQYDDESTKLVSTVQRRVLSATGLTIGGIHLASTSTRGDKIEVHCYSAFIMGGKLLKFPTNDHRGASWITPSLALTLRGISPIMVDLMKGVAWIGG